MLSPDPASLIAQIKAAFAQIEYPGHDRIVTDRSGYDLESNEIAAVFRGKHWCELKLDFLFYHRQSLYFFTPEAYRFYLPAYLTVSLDSNRMATDVRESLVFSLTPSVEASKDWDWLMVRVEPLSPAQKESVAEFLKYLQTHHARRFLADEIKTPLDRYWARFIVKSREE